MFAFIVHRLLVIQHRPATEQEKDLLRKGAKFEQHSQWCLEFARSNVVSKASKCGEDFALTYSTETRSELCHFEGKCDPKFEKPSILKKSKESELS